MPHASIFQQGGCARRLQLKLTHGDEEGGEASFLVALLPRGSRLSRSPSTLLYLPVSMAEEEMTTQATQPVPEPEGAPPGQRLMIERMELTNFKSYANTVKIGPFDRNMTSVVGPNGSGKSNVIDAMLFVFGFKAKQYVFSPMQKITGAESASRPIDGLIFSV